MNEKEAKGHEEKLKKTIEGAQEGLKKSMAGIEQLTSLFMPLASKKVVTPKGVGVASLLKNNMVKIDFASESDAKDFYESLKEFNA